MRKNGERHHSKIKVTPSLQSEVFPTELLTEYAGSWSSDGDSASSDYLSSASSSSSDVTSNNETFPHSSAANVRSIESVNSARNCHFLSRAGIFTREEIIEQAIESWTDYVRLCRRSLSLLRENMVENYVRCAVEERFANCPDSLSRESYPCNGSNSAGKRNPSPDSHATTSRQSRELRALRRLGRYSSKIENQRRVAALSKFAVISARLAPWKKPGVGRQCKYRDPTTTTWEHRCTRPCLPALSFCAAHLVQSQPPPPTSTSVESGSLEACLDVLKDEEGAGEGGDGPLRRPAGSKQLTRKNSSTRLRLLSDNVLMSSSGTATTCSVGSATSAKTADLQLPPQQYLFRRCGGGPGKVCMEPVIAWSSSTRCRLHAEPEPLWRDPVTSGYDDVNSGTAMADLKPPTDFATLVAFLKNSRPTDDCPSAL
ncbi:Acetyl-CoA acetyltransferase, cytosolic [Sparganum proliferum]